MCPSCREPEPGFTCRICRACLACCPCELPLQPPDPGDLEQECCRDAFQEGVAAGLGFVEGAVDHPLGCPCYACWLVEGIISYVVRARVGYVHLLDDEHPDNCGCWACRLLGDLVVLPAIGIRVQLAQSRN